MKRWDIWADPHMGDGGMQEDPEGEYVLYEDAKALLAKAYAMHHALLSTARELKRMVGEYDWSDLNTTIETHAKYSDELGDVAFPAPEEKDE